MSQKWIRSKRWDDEHLTGVLLPVKVLLRTFSSVRLAVVLLTGIALYGTLASVPVGLLALIPTFLVYALTLIVCVVVVGGMPTFFAVRRMRRAGVGGPWRFLTGFLAGSSLACVGALAWHTFIWPVMAYDPLTGSGLRLFGGFVHAYKSTTVRRLPSMEMAELEFYGWWPMKLMLYAFVLNMMTATVRRIEFRFVNIGVLTVHTGIIVMALGSVYYARMKQEGDVVLFNAKLAAQRGGASPFASNFYDRLKVSLWLRQDGFWQQRPLRGIPRYNDYNLAAAWPDGAERPDLPDDGRVLSIRVPGAPTSTALHAAVDEDLRFDVVGYASFADGIDDGWVPADPGASPSAVQQVRQLELIFNNPDDDSDDWKVIDRFALLPARPADRVAMRVGGSFGIEYAFGFDPARWRDLGASVPEEARHALIIEIPATGLRQVVAVSKGDRFVLDGHTITVSELMPSPPFPIITPGFENGTSSLAVVRVEPPGGDAFDRWVYHRYPQIDQDLLASPAGGMPPRRAPDPSIRISYLDLSVLQVYFDERPDGSVRALARYPQPREEIDGGRVKVSEIGDDGMLPLEPGILSLRIAERTGAMRVRTPNIVPPEDRASEAVGTHQRAMLCVRVTSTEASWSSIQWLPFVQYLDVGLPGETDAVLPDGRRIRMAFGREQHGFPGFSLMLDQFEMLPYPHSDVPRDFRSDLIVWDRETGDHVKQSTSMNRPLLHRVPFRWRDDMPVLANASTWLITRFAPIQYKISQSGWDREGWMQSKVLVERGEIDHPQARWTILGIGNNPGIYIIAVGSILACAGVPWAFYIKPWLLRRKRDKIKRELAAQAGKASEQGRQEPAGVAEGV